MGQFLPRLVVAAMRGGAGKTTLSVGMAAAWKRRGKNVAPFKKGPDYIDAAWLSLAAERACRNLDLFLMDQAKVLQSFGGKAQPADVAIVEGNRGLYDGTDAEGHYSTAELAKLLKAPVILVVDGSKITRTAAALVLGCLHLDRQVDIRGVVLNRIAGPRHEKILRQTISEICQLPVLGAVPRLDHFPILERHLGLIPPQEHAWVEKALDESARLAENFLDLDGIWTIARMACPFPEVPEGRSEFSTMPSEGNEPVIGVMKDSAFQFYYPENLDALKGRGARIREVSALGQTEFSPVDALYIGGGFPETHAEYLAENRPFRDSLRREIENGLPVYAECGGFMFLGERLAIGSREYPMAGALPVSFAMEKRPQGHGYTEVEVEGENPFFPVGSRFRGHEFHYSRIVALRENAHFAFRMKRGVGIDGKRDGLCRKNVMASYTHLHSLATPEWAEALVRKARGFRLNRFLAGTEKGERWMN